VLAGLQGALGLAGRDSLDVGQQAGPRPVARNLPVARVGYPGGEEGLAGHHQAFHPGEVGIVRCRVGPQQGVWNEVGHERADLLGEGGHLRGEAKGGRWRGEVHRHGDIVAEGVTVAQPPNMVNHCSGVLSRNT
jgi:hypothetical protein